MPSIGRADDSGIVLRPQGETAGLIARRLGRVHCHVSRFALDYLVGMARAGVTSSSSSKFWMAETRRFSSSGISGFKPSSAGRSRASSSSYSETTSRRVPRVPPSRCATA